MPLLFVYGTLKKANIQKEIIGRKVEGKPDKLIGFKQDTVLIENKTYPALIPNPQKETSGIVIEVTEDELKKIDSYETKAYTRVEILLSSGTKTFVYIKNFTQK